MTTPSSISRPPERLTRELLWLALPIVGMTVTRLLMQTVDFVMVSQLGTDAQAAISPASILVFTIACIGMGICNGVQTFVSQSVGRGEPHNAGAYAWQSCYVAGVVALLTLPLAATTEHWFSVLARVGEHSPPVAAMEIAYLRICLWMAPAAALVGGFEAFFNGIQKPRISFIAALGALAIVIAGNWLLIFGNLGFPRLGIVGSAIATALGWWVRAGTLFIAFLRPSYDATYHTRHAHAFSWERMRGILYVGGPTALTWVIDIGSWVVFMVLMMPRFGTAVMAATNIGLQCMHLSFMPAVGVGIALCSQVGHAIGAGDRDLAVRRTSTALRLTIGYMGAVGLLFLLLRHPLVWVLNSDHDPAVIAAGGWVLMWAAIFQAFDAMGITYMNALRGAGDTRWPALLAFVLCWGLFVGGGTLMTRFFPQFGFNGPWVTCTAYVVLLGLGLGWRWYAGRWRAIRLFGTSSATTANAADAPTAGTSIAEEPVAAQAPGEQSAVPQE